MKSFVSPERRDGHSTMAFLKRTKDPFREIQSCLQKRDYKGALVWFKPLIEKDSKNTQVRLRYADTLVLAGSKKEAIRQYRKVADELAEAGFMIRAIAINKKIVQLDPTQSDVHEKLAAMNVERSQSATARSALPLQMSQPPRRVESPPPGESKPPVKAEPTLSLEESMAMEFGHTPQASPVEARPAGAEFESAPVEQVPIPVEDEEVVEIDLEGVALEDSGQSMGFEVAEQGGPTAEANAAPGEAEAEEEPAVELQLEEVEGLEEEPEPAAGAPTPPFEGGEDLPSFSEEPVVLAAREGAEVEEEVEIGAEELEGPAKEEEEEELETGFEIKSEAEEVKLGAAATEEPAEEAEELEVEIETEPEMAANGKNPLVGLLGEDIDSLIDSIIDDVGSSVAAPPSPPRRQSTRIPLFSDLTAEEFVDVAIMLVRRSEKAGTVIVREGDPGESMFIVSTGEVEATREVDGRRVRLATLRNGDFFGEMAVLSGEPRSATVTTIRNTELLELSRSDLQQICSRHPEVEAKLRLAYDERRMASS